MKNVLFRVSLIFTSFHYELRYITLDKDIFYQKKTGLLFKKLEFVAAQTRAEFIFFL